MKLSLIALTGLLCMVADLAHADELTQPEYSVIHEDGDF